jgi:hypothetical protein
MSWDPASLREASTGRDDTGVRPAATWPPRNHPALTAQQPRPGWSGTTRSRMSDGTLFSTSLSLSNPLEPVPGASQ